MQLLVTLSLAIFILCLKGKTADTANLPRNKKDNDIKSASSTSNCSVPQCNVFSNDKNIYISSSTPYFDYRTLNDSSYCAPNIPCSILEPCNNVTYECASNTSVCIINSCCSPQAVCLLLSLTELYKSGWSNGSSIDTARDSHTASILTNGNILITGGYNNSVLSSAQVYNLANETWTNTGNMNSVRYHHTESILKNGKVLVTGGNNGTNQLNSAELYDSPTQTWILANSMKAAREFHTGTTLTNGKVLITGGYNNGIIQFNAE
ncbi:unnamed protein product [Adineta steineri]|uniref:Uncharacterized protein n=1 Tax=Adineta steineri TaxID=433720 RepID=A0A818TW85_9BILA|nr:unnamed protein product [Adineta steineri]